MNTTFETFYKNVLMDDLKAIETKRKWLLVRLAILTGFVLSFLAGYHYVFVVIWQNPTYLLYYLPTFFLVFYGGFKTFDIIIKDTSFYNTFKNKIILKTILFLNNTLKYDKDYFISKDIFFESNLFPETRVKYKGEDYVKGNITDDVSIEFSEIHVKNYENGKNMFKGLFYKAEIPFIFPIDFIIEPYNIENKESYLETNNELFDYIFGIKVVKANSIYNPSLFLTDAFLNGIVDFSERFQHDIYFSFIGNKIYMGIEHKKDIFEPTVFTTNTNANKIYDHYNEVNQPIEVIKNILLG